MLDSLVNPSDSVDSQFRLRQLERENVRLRDLVRSLTDAARGRVRARRPLHPIAAQAPALRQCEFCGCNTNAEERLCCVSGRAADRQSWDAAE